MERDLEKAEFLSHNMCVCVCVYVCIHLYTYIDIHTHTHTHLAGCDGAKLGKGGFCFFITYACIHLYTYIYIRTHTNTWQAVMERDLEKAEFLCRFGGDLFALDNRMRNPSKVLSLLFLFLDGAYLFFWRERFFFWMKR